MRVRLPALVLLVVAASSGSNANAQVQRSAGSPPVAITTLVSGHTTVTDPAGTGERQLQLLERLTPQQVVCTTDTAAAVITYFDGQRFRLPASTTARVEAQGLVAAVGRVERLAPVLASPSLSPILASEAPGTATAAARLRHDAQQCGGIVLDPGSNEQVIAGRCTLRFTPLPQVRAYRVKVEDQDLATVLELVSESSEVEVSPGLLEPGAEYYWSVCPVGRARLPRCTGAVFRTLTAAQTADRDRLAGELGQRQEPDSLVLLAELDRCLGLYHQACTGLHAALEAGAGRAQLLMTLERFGCTTGGSGAGGRPSPGQEPSLRPTASHR